MPTPLETYTSLMRVIRERFDLMDQITRKTGITYSEAEIVAYNARKIVEGIAFGCLVAAEHGLNHVPQDARGQYNAEAIFRRLDRRELKILPSPSEARQATPREQSETGAKVVLEGIPLRRLTYIELIEIYRQLHEWAHELNPYVVGDRQAYVKARLPVLFDSVQKISLFISNHVISIQGHGFFCVLKDEIDGLTKVISLQKVAS